MVHTGGLPRRLINPWNCKHRTCQLGMCALLHHNNHHNNQYFIILCCWAGTERVWWMFFFLHQIANVTSKMVKSNYNTILSFKNSGYSEQKCRTKRIDEVYYSDDQINFVYFHCCVWFILSFNNQLAHHLRMHKF